MADPARPKHQGLIIPRLPRSLTAPDCLVRLCEKNWVDFWDFGDIAGRPNVRSAPRAAIREMALRSLISACIHSAWVQAPGASIFLRAQKYLCRSFEMEIPMLRNAMIAAAAIAMMPALAMAAPATTKPANAATQTVKAESVALIKHHKTRLVHKVRMERHPKAKTVTTKS
jgi:hypothetical protein